MMKFQEIYVVTTEGDCEGRTTRTIGYATGDPEDIKAYYEPQKMYEIKLEKAKVMQINPQAVQTRRNLLDEKRDLEEKQADLEKRLKDAGLR
jgi:hypothetical protein